MELRGRVREELKWGNGVLSSQWLPGRPLQVVPGCQEKSERWGRATSMGRVSSLCLPPPGQTASCSHSEILPGPQQGSPDTGGELGLQQTDPRRNTLGNQQHQGRSRTSGPLPPSRSACAQGGPRGRGQLPRSWRSKVYPQPMRTLSPLVR